jgi:hypothetical protein
MADFEEPRILSMAKLPGGASGRLTVGYLRRQYPALSASNSSCPPGHDGANGSVQSRGDRY